MKLTTIRVVLRIVVVEDLHIEQLDVKIAFLYGDLVEDIYIMQPQGFTIIDKERLVCKLKKIMYGLKQASRQWYKKFDGFMCNNGFMRCQTDHCSYVKRFDDNYIILFLYVDDMLIAWSNIQKMSKQFAMKDLSATQQILGMRISRDRTSGTLVFSQVEYVKRVLNRFNMQGAKPVSTHLASHF